MIISRIIGGLGNQMFQYAAGRALSLKKDTRLLLDTSGFKNYGLHQGFELDKIFKAEIEQATTSDISMVLSWKSPPLVRNIFKKSGLHPLFTGNNWFYEPDLNYDYSIKLCSDAAYLEGYFQTEKYFKDVEKIIRNDFTFSAHPSTENSRVIDRIVENNSVSLHIRRGDYVNNPVHGICSSMYYNNAISYVARNVDNPIIYIYSDDIDWVKENLIIKYPHEYVINNSGSESYNDMRLMSLCKHNVIANSSFSWWAAWLNKNKNKIVLAPKNWFSNEALQSQSKSICPENWIRL